MKVVTSVETQNKRLSFILKLLSSNIFGVKLAFYEVALDGNCIYCFPLEDIKSVNSMLVLQSCSRCCWGPVPQPQPSLFPAWVGFSEAHCLRCPLRSLVRLSPCGPYRYPALRCAPVTLAPSFPASLPHPHWCLLGSLFSKVRALRALVCSWGTQIKTLVACEFQILGTTD